MLVAPVLAAGSYFGMATGRDRTPPPTRGAEVGLYWSGEPKLPLVFTDQVHVHRAQGRVYLTFGQVNLPLLEGPPPPDGLTVPISTVARLVVEEEDMRRILGVIASVMSANNNV